MSKICEVCGKAPSFGRSVSHSHRVTNRMFRPNIQKVTISHEKGRVRKAPVGTSCMKAAQVERAEPLALGDLVVGHGVALRLERVPVARDG